jgi:hypothetical protein
VTNPRPKEIVDVLKARGVVVRLVRHPVHRGKLTVEFCVYIRKGHLCLREAAQGTGVEMVIKYTQMPDVNFKTSSPGAWKQLLELGLARLGEMYGETTDARRDDTDLHNVVSHIAGLLRRMVDDPTCYHPAYR